MPCIIITKTININEEIMRRQLPLIQTRFLKKHFQICKQAAYWDVYFEILSNKRAGVFNKTLPASLLNGFKHDYKFNRYTALLEFFI
jgi:hypothetical protein